MELVVVETGLTQLPDPTLDQPDRYRVQSKPVHKQDLDYYQLLSLAGGTTEKYPENRLCSLGISPYGRYDNRVLECTIILT